ncbi:nucleolar and coiled-body phosphoprotein 1-like isoform X1 [Dysidea avara]|uniref:nucleolar and coiled-body phosphoprotein 1-like isoform X1 n=1 Tax=Dysidea avara TaxID=196820 RepID=UPI00331B29CE
MSEVRINASGHDRPVLRDLVNNVVTDQWYYLGLQLLEPKYENELNIIEGDAKNDVKTCCRKMFSKWLNTDKLASWDKVIEALTVIGLNSLANNVKQLLQQGTRQANATGHQPESSTKKASVPGKKRKQEDTIHADVTRSAPKKGSTKITVEELQKKLKERHLKISGTKPELIERLKQADSSNSYTESTDTTRPPNVKKPKNDPDKGPKNKVKPNVTGESSTKDASVPGKKRKQEDTIHADVTRSAPNKDITKITVEELQKKLKERHLKISGTKPELIERLKQADSSNNSTDSIGITGHSGDEKLKFITGQKRKQESSSDDCAAQREHAKDPKVNLKKKGVMKNTDATDGPPSAKKQKSSSVSAEKIPVIKTREKEGGTNAVATQSVTSKGSTKMIANKVLQDQGLNASVMKMKQVVRLVGAASSKGNLDGGESPNPLKQNSSPAAASGKGKGKKAADSKATGLSDLGKAVTAQKNKGKGKKHKVDEHVPFAHLYKVVDDWNCILNQTSTDNKDKFCIMQILKSRKSDYYLWSRSRWGSKGVPGTNHMKGPWPCLDDPTKEFKKRFSEKTNNKWENRHNFVPKPDKYTLLEAR